MSSDRFENWYRTLFTPRSSATTRHPSLCIQAAHEAFGVLSHELLLPGLETDWSLVLAPSAVLREQTDPALRVHGDVV